MDFHNKCILLIKRFYILKKGTVWMSVPLTYIG